MFDNKMSLLWISEEKFPITERKTTYISSVINNAGKFYMLFNIYEDNKTYTSKDNYSNYTSQIIKFSQNYKFFDFISLYS